MRMKLAFALLFFAFFFITLTGCRSIVRIGTFPISSELQILQSIAIEAHPVSTTNPQDNPESDPN